VYLRIHNEIIARHSGLTASGGCREATLMTTLQFASEGGAASFCGRREKLGQEVESEIRSRGGEGFYIRADVRNESDVQAFNPSCMSNRGPTEYSTARNSLRIIVLLSFSAIVANDVPPYSSIENRTQLSENKDDPR
jgi:hypothetical protein